MDELKVQIRYVMLEKFKNLKTLQKYGPVSLG